MTAEYWDSFASALGEALPGLELRRGEPMSRHTSFRVGGPAALMALPGPGEVEKTVKTAAQWGVTPFFLGNGTNLLVSDQGYDGFVLKLSAGNVSVRGTTLTADGGASLSRVAGAALEHGLTGMEFAAGIPGSVGGAVTMNAGAYGGEIAQVLRQVTVMSPEGAVETLPAAACDLAYRHSAFSDGRRLILEAVFDLREGEKGEIRALMDDLAARRREKQPLEYPSAGSTFKRPEGHFAAALIDQCGLKGLTVGGAQVSEKHAGFVINRGGATCADVLALMERVKSIVWDKTGVILEPEVKLLGV